MAKMLLTPSVTHRVSLSGRVSIGYQDPTTNETKKLSHRIRQARVELNGGPVDFQRRLKLKALSYGPDWDSLPMRPDRTETAEDGSFCFLDLPPGEYQLTADWPPGRVYLGTATAIITILSAHQTSGAQFVDLVLPTTGVKGRVTRRKSDGASGDSLPLVGARVQLIESDMETISDRDGEFLFLNLEPAQSLDRPRRVTLKVTADQHHPREVTDIVIRRGDMRRVDDVVLALTQS